MGVSYVGWGDGTSREELFEMLNYTFGHNGIDKNFETMFPALYKESQEPEKHNLIVRENGKLVAAVGVFPRKIRVGEETLESWGIGNVAVHPAYRGRGYMQQLMKLALEKMLEAGIDMSDLGGQRQRYQYFGYEIDCPPVYFRTTKRTVNHHFRQGTGRQLDLHVMTPDDTAYWDAAYALHEKSACRVLRGRELFPDVTVSHYNKAVAVLENGHFLGYYTGELTELSLEDPADLPAVLAEYVGRYGEVTFPIAPWDTEMLRIASDFCEEASAKNREKCTIFHFKKVISAYLKLEAGYLTLPEGSRSYLVKGFAGDEAFTVTVRGGQPSVTPCAPEEAETVLEHCEAINFFFGIYSDRRRSDPFARAMFPLPMYFTRADHV